jgi:magnesium transporter
MLFAYTLNGNSLERRTVENAGALPSGVIWADLVTPTSDEEHLVESAFGIAVPTREEMAEIEPSSRLYIEDHARFMTASLIYDSDTDKPKITVVTFIIANGKLVTVRYDAPKPFARVAAKLARSCSTALTGESVMIEILDAIIDRSADVLERAGTEVDLLSRRIFERGGAQDTPNQSYQAILRGIGRKADLTSKVRESLVSIGRLVIFLANETDNMKLTKEQRVLVKSMARDATSLNDHASFLINKIQFLLDATLGMVSLDQNNVIKIFSVVAVVLMPPTLLASIYGMNFKHMPELEWAHGYPFALGLMIVAAIAPYLFFKWKRWL